MNRALFSKNLGKYLEKSQILCTGFIYLGNYILFKKSSDPLGEARMTNASPKPFSESLDHADLGKSDFDSLFQRHTTYFIPSHQMASPGAFSLAGCRIVYMVDMSLGA